VPIAQQLGVDLIHYGILMTTVMGIALFLPPVGVGLYIVLGLSGASLGETSLHFSHQLGASGLRISESRCAAATLAIEGRSPDADRV
jgi:TRAP-type C4-dicarboxylate transport system permease large subunit